MDISAIGAACEERGRHTRAVFCISPLFVTNDKKECCI